MFPKLFKKKSEIKTDWCAWMRTIDYKPASINVDCNAHNHETKDLHYFIAVIIRDLGTSRNGFPTADKYKEIYPFEEKLEKIVNKSKDKYTGRFITNGEGFYLIYTSNPDKIKQKLNDFLKDCAFPYEISEKEDKEWKLYFDMIYPPAKQKQRYHTSVLIRNIATTGEDLDKEHIIDHAIFFTSNEDRNQYMDALKKAKFPIERYEQFDNEDKTFTLEVSVKSPLKTDLVTSSVDTLIDLAEKHNAVYDGWGTGLIK